MPGQYGGVLDLHSVHMRYEENHRAELCGVQAEPERFGTVLDDADARFISSYEYIGTLSSQLRHGET